jgi:N-acetylglucosaminyl-diphospho-decaprenol L-rhamnosyltransferase
LSDAIAVVVVTHDSAGELDELLPGLDRALGEDDEVVFVDNASGDSTLAQLRERMPEARLVAQARNLGFGAGCRAGAEASGAPLLLFLNPDVRLDRESLERLRAIAVSQPAWAAWQPALMLPDGRINTSGGVAHFLGFGWAGQCDQPAELLADHPHEVAFASGAALVIRRDAWEALSGFDDSYFLYGEDLDLGLRLWLTGRRVGVEPRARVVHHYTFDKGAHKWRLLERNRWLTLLADYPAPLLVALAPALAACEIGLLLIAARDGWLRAKLRANLEVALALPTFRRRRRRVQSQRTIGTGAFAQRLSSALDNPYVPALPRPLMVCQAAYFALVRRLLRSPGATWVDGPC